jgi:predicted PurR-regulated permease PerM
MSKGLIPEDQRQRIVSLIVIVGLLVTVWYMLDLVLLTFLLTFIFYHLLEKIQCRYVKILGRRLPDPLIMIVLYVFFVGAVSLLSIEVFPKLVHQFNIIATALSNFDIAMVQAAVGERMAALLSGMDFNSYLGQAGTLLAEIFGRLSGFLLNLFIALILSFAIIAEKKKIAQFGINVSKSNISFIYDYFVTYGGGFCKTFGQVMKVQVTIAFINSILTAIALSIFGYPAVAGLGLMVFLLGLIPVAGVIISFIPLSVIGFTIGGFLMVFKVILFILLLHAFEAYIMNPKLMSRKTRLPVCFVFLILLIGEHYMGVWGLLIGVPIFIFLMTAFKVDYQVIDGQKRKGKCDPEAQEPPPANLY